MRTRETLGAVERPCLLCGSADVVAVRTRLERRGLAKLSPGFDPHDHRYELCRGCVAKNLESAAPRQPSTCEQSAERHGLVDERGVGQRT